MSDIESGYRCREPAKETVEFMKETRSQMNKFDISVTSMRKDIEAICKALEDNSREHKEIMDAIKNFATTADRRYANKLAEKIVYGAVGLILTTVMLSLIYLLVKQ
jgi:hypothetical protein